MSGELHSAGMTDVSKTAGTEEGDNKDKAVSNGQSAPSATACDREYIIVGMNAESATFFTQSSYYDRRPDGQGDKVFPKNMRQADEAHGKTKLVLENCKVGDKPVIGAKYAYFHESTQGAGSGQSTRTRDGDSKRTNFIAYLSGVLNTLPRERLEKLAKELEDTFEIFAADDLHAADMDELNGLQTIKATQKRKFLKHVKELQS